MLSVFTALAQEDIKHLAHFGLAPESLSDFQTGEKNIVGATFAVTTTHPCYGLLQANFRNDDIPSVRRQIVHRLYEIVWRAFGKIRNGRVILHRRRTRQTDNDCAHHHSDNS